MFLIIFGLRGYKHKYESQVGLGCAHEIFEMLNTMPLIVSTSVGVTTGITYCGIVGHTLRREYSVIGLTVNKAARLMMNYPNKVSCDNDTFEASQLNVKYFNVLPKKVLKGIQNVGVVYEYLGGVLVRNKQKNIIGLSRTESSNMIHYDWLTSYEQLVCKCASVLDDKFSKSMLRFVLSSSVINDSTLDAALRRIGEVFLITCCDDVTRLNDTCKCLQLSSEEFKQSISKLLIESQKIKFHLRAIAFLERYTKTCVSCGERYILPGKYFNVNVNDSCASRIGWKEWIQNLFPRPLQHQFNIAKYSMYDFTKCDCDIILFNFYRQLIIHSREAGTGNFMSDILITKHW